MSKYNDKILTYQFQNRCLGDNFDKTTETKHGLKSVALYKILALVCLYSYCSRLTKEYLWW